MSSIERIFNIAAGVLMAASALIMIFLPDIGAIIVLLILAFSLIAFGIRTLIYYVTMARHMVGGRLQLYLGIIVLDFGAFALTLTDVPKVYIMLYLLGIHAFSAVVSILRAFEAKRFGASSWKMKFFMGIAELLIAAACGVFINSMHIMVYIYAGGLLYSAVMRIIEALRKTAIAYIP